MNLEMILKLPAYTKTCYGQLYITSSLSLTNYWETSLFYRLSFSGIVSLLTLPRTLEGIPKIITSIRIAILKKSFNSNLKNVRMNKNKKKERNRIKMLGLICQEDSGTRRNFCMTLTLQVKSKKQKNVKQKIQ